MFRHRQQLRRWAARVLLLWLFGVGASVAHACLTPSLLQFGQPSAAASALAHHQISSPEQAHEGCHGHEGPKLKSNCADFCDKASVSIPPLKSALDDVQGHALQFPAVALAHPAAAHVPVQLQVPRRDGAWAPPILIAFLRLAL